MRPPAKQFSPTDDSNMDCGDGSLLDPGRRKPSSNNPRAVPSKPTPSHPSAPFLRRKIQESFQRHQYETAIFHASAVLSLTERQRETAVVSGQPEEVVEAITDNLREDVFALAESYFLNREYARALHLLTQRYPELTERDNRLKLLAIQSLTLSREHEEVLAFMKDVCGELEEEVEAAGTPGERNPPSEYGAAFALVKAKVYESAENQERALCYYKKAALLDGYCHEAVSKLVGTHLLTKKEEALFLQKLKFRPEDEWLREVYRAKSSADDTAIRENVKKSVSGQLEDAGMTSDPADDAGLGGLGGVYIRPRAAAARLSFAAPPGETQVSTGVSQLTVQALRDQELDLAKMVPKLPEGMETNSYVVGALAEKFLEAVSDRGTVFSL